MDTALPERANAEILRLTFTLPFGMLVAQIGPRGTFLMARRTQSHGQNSRVYVPIIKKIFRDRYVEGVETIEFTLDDIRAATEALGVSARTRNAGDVIYRMRARTELPEEIRSAGFYIIRQIGRGKYRMEKATGIIVDLEENPAVIDALDTTPLPVRRLLPERLQEIDEQGLLTVINYCKIIDHFTGLTVYRLRSHVRKSVAGVGQAEVDEVDVGVALSDDEIPIIFPIEAKAAPDSINRVQISMQVQFARQYFPGYAVRPLAVKIDDDGLIHCLEFNDEATPANSLVLRRSVYRLRLSERQREMIQNSITVVL